MPEVFKKFETKIDQSDIFKKLNVNENYFLLSLHREENVDNKIFRKY